MAFTCESQGHANVIIFYQCGNFFNLSIQKAASVQRSSYPLDFSDDFSISGKSAETVELFSSPRLARTEVADFCVELPEPTSSRVYPRTRTLLCYLITGIG
ncbi:hypothetical protein PoB_001003500 [Plakobranchus ocellatus]|uniref:Uncharacterized protein n=1 Tax=Plakobranchus ocellatus TaxID=259542 RepID=A0AAV3YM03_9GAST|nr:hypothetical protein PoB_001003500 [Plakobranchus ocellatus]